MQTHGTIGADTLHKVARDHGFGRVFLHMAANVALSYHERYDGKGYPVRLAGDAVPLATRLVAIAEAYDTMGSWRCYPPPVQWDQDADADRAIRRMIRSGPLQAFLGFSHRFEGNNRELTNELAEPDTSSVCLRRDLLAFAWISCKT